jgi:hypothetical protein
MSYAIMPYSVYLPDVAEMVGCGREESFEVIAEKQARRLREIDGALEDLGPAGAPSARTALRQMIMGEPYDDRVGFAYGYCVELLCQVLFAEFLPNAYWSGMHYGWFETVADGLKDAGIRFDPADLVQSGAPIDLPMFFENPLIGHVTPAEMPALLERLDGIDDRPMDEQVRGAAQEIRGWLRTCLGGAHRSLICFYY